MRKQWDSETVVINDVTTGIEEQMIVDFWNNICGLHPMKFLKTLKDFNNVTRVP